MKHIKNDRDVVTIPLTATLREAATEMEERLVGSLVVVDRDGLAVGILTDRDLCTRAVAFDHDPDASTVERCMSTPLRTIQPSRDPYEQVAAIRRAGARRLPVLDESSRPVGIVTADDELRWIASILYSLGQTAQPGRFHGALRPASMLLDDLELHLDLTERVDESDRLSCREMMKAIDRLRQGLQKDS